MPFISQTEKYSVLLPAFDKKMLRFIAEIPACKLQKLPLVDGFNQKMWFVQKYLHAFYKSCLFQHSNKCCVQLPAFNQKMLWFILQKYLHAVCKSCLFQHNKCCIQLTTSTRNCCSLLQKYMHAIYKNYLFQHNNKYYIQLLAFNQQM